MSAQHCGGVRVSLQARLERIERIEFTPPAALAFCFAVTQVRVLLEAFSDIDNLWSPVAAVGAFVHYPMFFGAVLLAFALILRRVTGESIGRITRVLTLFFPVVLVAPLADLALSAGRGFNMAYLFGDARELLTRFFTFGGFTTRGATPGIRIELIGVFALLAIYGYAKTGSVCRAGVAVGACYTAGFALGSLPTILTLIWPGQGGVTGPSVMAGGVVLNHFYSFDHKAALALLPVLLVEGALWRGLGARRRLPAPRDIHIPGETLHIVGMLGIGMLIGATCFPPADVEGPFPMLIIVAAVCAVVMAWVPADDGTGDLPGEATTREGAAARPQVSTPVAGLMSFALAAACAWIVREAFLTPLAAAVGLRLLSRPCRRYAVVAAATTTVCSVGVCLAGFILFSPDYSFSGFPPRILVAILVGYAVGSLGVASGEGARPTYLHRRRRAASLLRGIAYLTVPLLSGSAFLWPPAFVASAASVVATLRGARRVNVAIHGFFLVVAAVGIVMGRLG